MEVFGGSSRENMNLTKQEHHTLEIAERSGASISLISVFAVFVVYGLFPRVRTVPNTFIFFASVANLGATIACLIGLNGLRAGEESALCQAQAFLFEMFMQSDPWWSFAMAVNVFMVFFMAYPPNNLRKNLWIYCLICFGIPALPAFVCLIYRPNGERIYGDATMWCWISDKHNSLRIYIYYLPIWMCILLSSLIYVAVGYHVFHQRNKLRNLTFTDQVLDTAGTGMRESEKEQQSYGTVTTEVQITAESSSGRQTPPSSTPTGSVGPALPNPLPPPDPASQNHWRLTDDDDDIEAAFPTSACRTNNSHASEPKNNSILINPNINSNNQTSFATSSTAVSSSRRPPRKAKRARHRWMPAWMARIWNRFRRKLANMDPIKLAYLRTSFVYAVSVLVTWTPSSINRIYTIVNPSHNSFALNMAGAIVLSLQGLWNAIIFAASSYGILKDQYYHLRYGTGTSSTRVAAAGAPGGDDDGFFVWMWGLLRAWWSCRRGSVDSLPAEMARRQQQGLAASTWPRDGGCPETRELANLPNTQMRNVRVFRGSTL
ncbi:hypothetical protein VTH82DRAFT_3245 [Thermothelomyces myriococcoides]